MQPRTPVMTRLQRAAWEPRPVALKYRFGEINIGVWCMPFQVLECHFTALDTDLTRSRPRAIERGLQGALIRSHPIATELPVISHDDEYMLYVPHRYNRYFIDMTGTFDDYLKKFSTKTRSTLGRRIRKFAEHSGGTVDFRSYTTPEQIAEFYELARPLSELTYQERLLEVGLPCDAESIDRAVAAAHEDRIRAFLLFHAGQPVAYLYCPIRYGAILEYEHLGYDPAYSKWSVGTVLQQLALERLFAERRFSVFDFTEGDGEHKRQFSTGSTRCADLWYFRRTPGNELVVRSHDAFCRLVGTVTMATERMQLRTRLKQLTRRWV